MCLSKPKTPPPPPPPPPAPPTLKQEAPELARETSESRQRKATGTERFRGTGLGFSSGNYGSSSGSSTRSGGVGGGV